MNRKERIFAFMRSDTYVPLKFEELALVLDVPETDLAQFNKLLCELIDEGRVVITKKGRYMCGDDTVIAGTFCGTDKGFGFIEPDTGGKDLFISRENIGGAMHGDKIVAKILSKASDNKKGEAKVIKITERVNKTLVCTLFEKSGKLLAKPDNKKIYQYIKIHPAHTQGAEKGQKAVVKITAFPKDNKDAVGEVVEILGWVNSPETTMLAVLRTFGIPEKFPEEVMAEAKKAPKTVPKKDLAGRRDLRNELIITIDGEDARDLDDAVTVKRDSDGNFILGVHIADVSHYVRPGMAIDNEAVERGTSVYLAGGVIPMLPPALSNGICSLNENQDRLTLSCEMTFSPKGKLISHDIFESVIKTAHRMTYTDVTKILEGDKKLINKYSDIYDMLLEMKELAEILRAGRMKDGSIDFNFPEPKLVFDDEGRVIDVYKYEYTISNAIIEEFMLAANKTVAEHFFWLEMPFVYRIHETPSEEKIRELVRVLAIFNESLKGMSNNLHPKALAQVLENVKDKPSSKTISTVMLRSMMKAKYSTENLGHFGLAAKYYCHFTSPIRRLADLAIHRIIKDYLHGKNTDFGDYAALAAKNASTREVVAQDAERLSTKLKVAEYMSDFVGAEFEGVISSITQSGFYVELENTVEGRVALSDIEDDYYNYIETSYSLVGERTGQSYKIGDKITVFLARADKITGELDFIPV
ncbi:MAG: ribonuclease R [Clostridia bacterium]|nr:ribonuclease R [Clostridia bacterium]